MPKENSHIFAGIEDSVKEQMERLKIQREKDKESLLKIPDPTVFKHDCPVKAMLVLDGVILTGNDRGEIKVIDKKTFK